jgi:hypothetical protein
VDGAYSASFLRHLAQTIEGTDWSTLLEIEPEPAKEHDAQPTR